MQRVPAHGGASTGLELKPPAVERAYRLAVFNPSQAHRSVFVGASAEERVVDAVVVEDRDPQAVDFDAPRSTHFDVLGATNGDKTGHAIILLDVAILQNLKDSDLHRPLQLL
jgi:hypothetical protein